MDRVFPDAKTTVPVALVVKPVPPTVKVEPTAPLDTDNVRLGAARATPGGNATRGSKSMTKKANAWNTLLYFN